MATIKIKQTRSRIGAPADQKRTLQAVGLHKISKVVECEDKASKRGMSVSVHRRVTVVE